jgi:hypothetical protein
MRVNVALLKADGQLDCLLGTIEMASTPRRRESLRISSREAVELYEIAWVTHTPLDPSSDVQVGCKPAEAGDPEVDRLASINTFLKENKETIVSLQSSIFDKASSYTTIVVAAGYAAAFTIWSNIKDLLPKNYNTDVAGLILFSFLMFVAWETGKMIYTSLSFSGLAASIKTAEDHDLIQAIADAERKVQSRNITLMRIWPAVLILTIVPALCAVSILFYRFMLIIAS